MGAPLKLLAEDAEDLRVIAACLQDAVLPIGEMTYQPREERFVMVVTRFLWEQAEEGGADERTYRRVHCAVRFDGITGVKARNLDRKSRARIVELLTMEPAERHIDLVFAGGGVIRLETNRIRCQLEDLDEPWATPWKPAHADEDDRGEDPA